VFEVRGDGSAQPTNLVLPVTPTSGMHVDASLDTVVGCATQSDAPPVCRVAAD
jgi:hypothetical protein